MTAGNIPPVKVALAEKPRLIVAEGRVWTTSWVVAERFERRHDNVIRDIRALAKDAPSAWCRLNFEETSLAVAQPNGGFRQESAYRISRDAFSILAMGFTDGRALQWKIAYVEAFNVMEVSLAPRAATPVQSAPLRFNALLYTRLLYALGHTKSWAMLVWCLLLMGAHEAQVRATYRELLHAVCEAMSLASVWFAMRALPERRLVHQESGGWRLDWPALEALLRQVPETNDARPGLLQAPPVMTLPQPGPRRLTGPRLLAQPEERPGEAEGAAALRHPDTRLAQRRGTIGRGAAARISGGTA